MKVLVCGSRDWDDERIMYALLAGLAPHPDYDDYVIIHGAARGADRMAGDWAEDSGSTPAPFPADWATHHPDFCPGDWCLAKSGHHNNGGRDFCYGAGPRRNQQMLDEGKPNLVLAFKDGFNWKLDKGGTEDMVKRAKAAGVPTYVIQRA